MSRHHILPFASLILSSQGKEQIGDFLLELFTYTFSILLNKKDSSLFRIREEGSPELAREKINHIASTMAYAHLAVILKYEDDPQPVTTDTHTAVADFVEEVTRDTALLLCHYAYICIDHSL